MKLRTKQIILIMVLIIIPLAVGVVFTYVNIKSRINSIEESNARKSLSCAKKYMNSIIDNQKSMLASWAYWDDLFLAVQKRDKAWMDKNVLPSAVENTTSEIIMVLDKKFDIIAAANSLPAWDRKHLSQSVLIKKLLSGTEYSSSLEIDKKGLYVLSAVKIVRENDKAFKHENGYIIFGRRITRNLIITGKQIMDSDITIRLHNGLVISTEKSLDTSLGNVLGNNIEISSKIRGNTMIAYARQRYYVDNSFIGVLSTKTTDNAGVAALNKLRQYSSILGLIILSASSLMLLWLNRNIILPLKKIAISTHRVSEKDLTATLQIDTHDETAMLARDFNSMVSHIKDFFRQVKDMSLLSTKESVNLTSSSKEMSTFSQHVLHSIQEVEKASTSQAEDLVNIDSNISAFGKELDTIENALSRIRLDMDGIKADASDSDALLEDLIHSTEGIQRGFEVVKDKITHFGVKLEEIDNITLTLNDLAGRITLLSINALIEASRAGESGRGFSVVANEIRKLAEKCKDSYISISGIIAEIHAENLKVKETSDDVNFELNKQISIVHPATASFTQIIQSLERIFPQIEAVSSMAVNMQKEKNSIIRDVESSVTVAEEICASSQEVTAKCDEMRRSSAEVALSALRLQEVTKRLTDELDAFKLD